MKADLGSIDTAFLYCRRAVAGHQREPIVTYVGTHRRRKVFESEYACLRCESMKESVVSAKTGVPVTAPRYTYQPGYLLQVDGMDRATLNREVRLEVFGRVAKPRTGRVRAVS